MPLQLDIKKRLHTRSDRVKSVDFHSSLPWLLVALYSGHLVIYNWDEQSTVRTIEASPNTAIRCARFIDRKQWVVCGSDDMCLRVFNYNSLEKVKHFEAHVDFIRYIAVHPTLPLLLTTSDDMSVRCWDWSRNWLRVASFEGHIHYVMMAQWHPTDPHLFASASLDRTIKVWAVSSSALGKGGATGTVVTKPHISLTGHDAGVSCLAYSCSGEKPYIVSGGEDSTVRVWDYQTKHCVSTLLGHNGTVLSVMMHPSLPLIISGGDDGSVILWHAGTFRKELVLNYNMGRVWGLACDLASNVVAVATDEGTIALKLGSDKPVASMHGGRIVVARANEVRSTNIRLCSQSFVDGEQIAAPFKEMGQCEVFAQKLMHHPNGRLLAICGDGEYVIYTSQALRSKAFGKAVDFAWSSSGEYATKEETGRIIVHRNDEELVSMSPPFPVDEMFGGQLLALKSTDFVCFYSWNELRLVRRIDVTPHGIHWNESGTEVILACTDAFYSLRYDADAVVAAFADTSNTQVIEEGVEAAFEFFRESSEKVDSGCWIAGCFVYTTPRLRLQTFTAGAIDTVAFLEVGGWTILGFVPELDRIFLVDRHHNLISFRFPLSYAQYMHAISRREFDLASEIFKKVPVEVHSKLGRFLEAQGHKETALQVTRDLDHKFELGLSLDRLNVCTEVLQEMANCGTQPDVLKAHWTRLGDAAIEKGNLSHATACYKQSEDVDGLFMIGAATADTELLRSVAEQAIKLGKINLAITINVLLNEVQTCIDLLLKTGRVPEAALFARTYAPDRCPDITRTWKKKLAEARFEEVADALDDGIPTN